MKYVLVEDTAGAVVIAACESRARAAVGSSAELAQAMTYAVVV